MKRLSDGSLAISLSRSLAGFSPFRRVLCSSAGFTYVAALMIVVIMGIMLGIAGETWRMRMHREREAELLFRGLEYQRAIRRWHQYHLTEGKPFQTTTRPRRPLNELKDLLKDPGSLGKERYLRRLYTDPFTTKEFEVVRNPQQGIIGVRSTAEDTPLKKGNFDKELSLLEQKNKYKEWVFGLPEAVAPAAGTVNLGSPAGPGSSGVPLGPGSFGSQAGGGGAGSPVKN